MSLPTSLHLPTEPTAPASPGGVVLLAAGSGRRMLPLTAQVPKALLSVGGRSVLDWMIEAVLARSQAEIVVVTGFAADAVEEQLARRHGARVRCVHNNRFADDVNILSVETGVSALREPARGYLVCETDLLLDDSAWDALFAGLSPAQSQWICRGRYGRTLTGGTVHARHDGRIDCIDYRPAHDSRCDGWDKMIGMLWVAPDAVSADRRLRQAAIDVSIAQYYLAPWQQNLHELPCASLRVDAGFAATFNTPAQFKRAASDFLARRHATETAAVHAL
jgi:choline kinase